MSDALALRGVVKVYRGGRRALDGLSFSVPSGVVCGLVGPNGAGKTTTFSILCGFLQADAGEVDVLGQGPLDAWALKGRVGVLPQDAELPDRHTPMEVLEHLARLSGMDARGAKIEAARCLACVDLTDRERDSIGSLSHGMRRRVAVASALLGSPDLVLLDEPTAGLDPLQARRVREVVASLRGRQTVVISSHNLVEIEQICDHVVMIASGRCTASGPVDTLTRVAERLSWCLSTVPSPSIVAACAPHDVRVDGCWLHVRPGNNADADQVSCLVMAALAREGVGLHAMRRGMSLEERLLDGPN